MSSLLDLFIRYDPKIISLITLFPEKSGQAIRVLAFHIIILPFFSRYPHKLSSSVLLQIYDQLWVLDS